MTLCGVAVRQGQANSQPRTQSAKHSSWLSSAVISKCSVAIAVSGGRSDAAAPHNRGPGQTSSSDMAAPHKFHFSRLKVSASTFVVSTGGSEPATCEAEAPTSVMGDCEFTERVVSTVTPRREATADWAQNKSLMVLVRCTRSQVRASQI